MSKWRECVGFAVVMVAPGAGYATEYLTVDAAQQAIFPEATAFEKAHVVFTPEQQAEIERRSGQKVTARGQQIWTAKRGDEILGWVIVDYVIGKHLVIDYAVGLLPSRRVKQVEIMQYRESYGGEIRNPDWRKQFVDKEASALLHLNEDITNIGGATLSCRHVTEGLKRVLVTFDVVHG